MEIGRLVGHPSHEFRNRWVGEQRSSIFAYPRQFGIAEIGVDRTVADRMYRHRHTPLLCLRHRVMMLDLATQPAFAQPAGGIYRFAQPFLSAAFFFFIASWKRSAQPGFTT